MAVNFAASALNNGCKLRPVAIIRSTRTARTILSTSSAIHCGSVYCLPARSVTARGTATVAAIMPLPAMMA